MSGEEMNKVIWYFAAVLFSYWPAVDLQSPLKLLCPLGPKAFGAEIHI